jgi:hypothetical protein
LAPLTELYSVLGIFDILIGLMHGIGFLNTENGNDCREYLDNQQVQVEAAMSSFEGVGGEAIIHSYFAGFNAIIMIGWEINDTFTNCYAAGIDSSEILDNYKTLLSDTSSLRTNLIDNFGLSYNAFRDLLTYFMGEEDSAIKEPFDFGAAIGFTFFFLLYPGAEEGEIDLS